MSDISNKTVCVFDHGLFVEVALRLARDFGRVLYYSPWEIGFPILNNCVIGDGFQDENVERVDEIWEHFNDIDLFVFTDIQNSELQLYLESVGKKVWGSRRGDDLELRRSWFKKLQDKLGMPRPEFESITGLSKLRDYLKEHEDRYVKISRFRGCMETWHHINYELSEQMLDHLAVKLGPLQDAIPFTVETPLVTDIEVGYDGITIDGQWPKFAIQGYEAKDRGLIAAVQEYKDLPEEITKVNDALSGTLKDFRYRNFFSTEIRVVEDESYLIDPTCRCPSPCIEIQLETWANLGEMMWFGAQGEMIDPEPSTMFGVECLIEHTGSDEEWRTLQIPEKSRRWTKLYSVCKHGDIYCIPPFPHSHTTIGMMVGIGDTIEEALEHLKENAELLKGQPVSIPTDALYHTLIEIRKAEEKGIEFTGDKLPEPESALT